MACKITKYFIEKGIADRLKNGDDIKPVDIALYGYKDLTPDNGNRLSRGDPEALISCDLVLGES